MKFKNKMTGVVLEPKTKVAEDQLKKSDLYVPVSEGKGKDKDGQK